MNTTTISAALPSASSGTDHNRNDGAKSQGNSFSSVLGTQQAALATPKNTQQTQDAAASQGHGSKPAQDGASDAELAQNAAEHGLAGAQATDGHGAIRPAQAEAHVGQDRSLPQVALQLAAEIAAVQQAVAGRGTVDGKAGRSAVDGKASTNRDFAARSGTEPASALPAGGLSPDSSTGARRSATISGDARPMPTSMNLNDGQAPATSGADTTFLTRGLPGKAANDKAGSLQGAPIGAARAASIAGAKQAVLTMQARAQAAQSTAGEPAGIQALGFDTSLSNALAGLSDGSAQRDTPLGDLFAPPATSDLNARSGVILATSGQHANANVSAIATPLSNPQWGADFSRQFVTLAQGGQNSTHTAELRLDPPELGPLRISISISDNVAHALFVSPHASVRQTVETSLSQLQQALAQAGISLGEASVSDQGQQAEHAFNESFGGGSARHGSGFSLNGGEPAEAASVPVARRAPAPDALVDTFA